MTWRGLLAFVVEKERLLWHIRFLRVKLAFVRARHRIRLQLRTSPNRDFGQNAHAGRSSSTGIPNVPKRRFGEVRDDADA